MSQNKPNNKYCHVPYRGMSASDRELMGALAQIFNIKKGAIMQEFDLFKKSIPAMRDLLYLISLLNRKQRNTIYLSAQDLLEKGLDVNGLVERDCV